MERSRAKLAVRAAGKNWEMFLNFQKALKMGTSVECHGPGYVVLPRARFEELKIIEGRYNAEHKKEE